MVGKIAPSDIKGTQGVIIEAGKRITARHIRLIESSKIKTLEVPKESLFNQTIAEDIVVVQPPPESPTITMCL